MKKTRLLVYLLILVGMLLTSCVELPEKPQDILPFCKELYEEQLAIYSDFPPTFIGFCVATLQTGEPKGYQGLCSSASFRDSSPEFSTRKECILYFQNSEPFF